MLGFWARGRYRRGSDCCLGEGPGLRPQASQVSIAHFLVQPPGRPGKRAGLAALRVGCRGVAACGDAAVDFCRRGLRELMMVAGNGGSVTTSGCANAGRKMALASEIREGELASDSRCS